jgi:hypothetical protein
MGVIRLISRERTKEPEAGVAPPCRRDNSVRSLLGVTAPDARHARHTEPPGAITADVLRLLAAWVVRAVGHGLIANNPEGSPIR